MEESQFLFFRGSTPTLELVLPLRLSYDDVIYLTLCQGGRPVLEYALNGSPAWPGSGELRRDEADENVLLLTMSQADTLALAHGDCELQLRLRTADGADTFAPCFGWVGQARRKGEI